MAHILIIEHDALTRQALASQLAQEHTLETAHDIAQAAELIAARRHRLALLNLELGPEDGKTLLPLLRSADSTVLAYSARSDRKTTAHCQEMGVAGLLLRGAAPLDMAAAVRGVLDGGGVHPASGAETAPPAGSLQAIIGTLTKRERKLLDWLMLGLCYKQIARVMHIEPCTARRHGARVIQKFNAQNRMRLPCIAFRLGFFPHDARLPDGFEEDGED